MRVASLIISLMVASSAWAEIGSVTEASGTAIIKRGKDTIQIAKGTLIETNDKIETKNGKVKIVFKDDTNVTVTESSSLVIDDFVYDPKSGAGKLGLKAAAGTVRYAVSYTNLRAHETKAKLVSRHRLEKKIISEKIITIVYENTHTQSPTATIYRINVYITN